MAGVITTGSFVAGTRSCPSPGTVRATKSSASSSVIFQIASLYPMINGSAIALGKGFMISMCALPAECTTHGAHFIGSKTFLYGFANDLSCCCRGNTLTGQIPGSAHGFFCQQV